MNNLKDTISEKLHLTKHTNIENIDVKISLQSKFTGNEIQQLIKFGYSLPVTPKLMTDLYVTGKGQKSCNFEIYIYFDVLSNISHMDKILWIGIHKNDQIHKFEGIVSSPHKSEATRRCNTIEQTIQELRNIIERYDYFENL